MSAAKWVLGAVLFAGAGAAATFGMQQWRSAEVESRRLAVFEGSATRPVLGVGGQTVADADVIDRALLKGRLDATRHALVPRELPDGRRGYDVWTPIEFRSGISMGEFAVINRGWVPESVATNVALLATPSEDVEIEGLWIPVPASSEDEISLETCASNAWPKIIGKTQPSYTDMKCLFNAQQIAQGIVLLTSRLNGGFENDWIGDLRGQASLHQRNAYLGFGLAVLALIAMLAVLLMKGGRKAAVPQSQAQMDAVVAARPMPAPKGKLVR